MMCLSAQFNLFGWTAVQIKQPYHDTLRSCVIPSAKLTTNCIKREKDMKILSWNHCSTKINKQKLMELINLCSWIFILFYFVHSFLSFCFTIFFFFCNLIFSYFSWGKLREKNSSCRNRVCWQMNIPNWQFVHLVSAINVG